MKLIPALGAALLLLAGCVSFEYEGVREPEPTENVKLFTDKAKIKRQYQVLGQAVASGDYMDVSRDRLEEKLLDKAAAYGANAVLITGQQVVPGEVQKNGNPNYMTAIDYDDTDRSWNQLYKDVDLNYGSVRGTPSDGSAVVSYRRVIRAEFLKYTDPEPEILDETLTGQPAPEAAEKPEAGKEQPAAPKPEKGAEQQ